MIKKSEFDRQQLIGWWGLLAVIAILVKSQSNVLFSFDQDGLVTVHQFLQPSQISLFKWLALSGSPVVTTIAIIGIAGWLLHRNQPILSLIAVTTIVGGDILTLFIKEAIQRPRPAFELVRESGFSFPSGHVFGATILAILIWQLLIPRIGRIQFKLFFLLLLIYWVGLVAISRIYLQVHFPSDVIGGFVLAQAWWQTVKMGYLRWEQQILTTVNQLTRSNPKQLR
ncbi:MAG: phosphatase PAP2 family protein [Lentilactobacillus diolivorans]|uniref:phosphatase PAP2 family protein n=1 Tax=Lentilactobacillus diolivorans TaxID=179838 RepID=UPI0039E8A377